MGQKRKVIRIFGMNELWKQKVLPKISWT